MTKKNERKAIIARKANIVETLRNLKVGEYVEFLSSQAKPQTVRSTITRLKKTSPAVYTTSERGLKSIIVTRKS